MTLYNVTDEYMQLMQLADDPEVDQEAFFTTWECIDEEFESKCENTAKVMKNLNSDSDALDAEIKRLTKKKKTIDNRVEWLKGRVKTAMETTEKTNFKSGIFSFKIVNNGGKLPLILDDGIKATDVPEEYRTIPEPVINNEAIRKALDEGKELAFAHYGERGTNLRIG